MKNPKVGDHFEEMLAFHVYVINVDGDYIYTLEVATSNRTNTILPNDGVLHKYTRESFIRRFSYDTKEGYWITKCSKRVNVKNWLGYLVGIGRTIEFHE